MVRKGSSVRVRLRASRTASSRCQVPFFLDLRAENRGSIRRSFLAFSSEQASRMPRATKTRSPSSAVRAGWLRAWWQSASYGTESPSSRVTALVLLGIFTGIAEAAVIVLIVALAAGGGDQAASLPLIEEVPDATWQVAAMSAVFLLALAAAHLSSARISARAAASAQREVQGQLLAAFLGADWIRQSNVSPGDLQDLVTVKAAMVSQGTEMAARGLSTGANLLILIIAAFAASAWASLGLLTAVAIAIAIGLPFRRHRRTRTSAAVGATPSSTVGDR